jgi:hypothetical protein
VVLVALLLRGCGVDVGKHRRLNPVVGQETFGALCPTTGNR